jgi:ABC-type Mn2+/Zn2+ transport system permease subunit
MIEAFFSSWPLFHNAYLSGWLIGLALSLIGVLIVARDQIFIGAAVSQASMLGIAVAILVGSWITLDDHHWVRSDVFHAAIGGLFSIIAALFTVRGSKTAGRESHEAVTGWVFLLSVSMSILLMSHSPHGLEEVHRILSSTIIGATRMDVWIFSGMTAVTVVTLWYCHRPSLLIVMDREMAKAVGLRVGWWDAIFSVWLGAVVGFSIHVAGVVYAFACLVLPAVIAKNLSREVRTMFFLSPLVALITGILSFVLANYYDYPPGQMATAVLCCLLVVAWAVHSLRPSRLLH